MSVVFAGFVLQGSLTATRWKPCRSESIAALLLRLSICSELPHSTVEGTAVAMGKIQTCQYCGKQGHNARSCPVLGLKVLKKLQVKHSVTAVTKAIMDGCEPLTVPGIERRRGSRKAARRLEHRRVRQVHKGTRGVSSARKKNAAQTKRRWAEQRRTAKRQTKCEAKVKLAEDKRRIRQAWKKLQEMQLVPKPMRSYRQFPCPQCAANCVCRPVLDSRDRAADCSQFREELKRAYTMCTSVVRIAAAFSPASGSQCCL